MSAQEIKKTGKTKRAGRTNGRNICLHVYREQVSLFLQLKYDIYNSFLFVSSQIYHMALHFYFSTGMYVTVVYLHVPFVHKIIHIKGFTKIKYSGIFLNGILLDYM